ncbi:hypothetical protein ACFYW1_13100 [Streptomyces sp. NPDC002669]|uniref:hypothetical protein n=1 Tax=Streptomyces sp. NPDC002669 TaxID=3364658 RepID=UPI0036B9D22F
MSTSDQERAVDAPIPDTKDGSGDGPGAATKPADGPPSAKTDGAASAKAPRAVGEAAPAEGPGAAAPGKTAGKATGRTAGEAGERTAEEAGDGAPATGPGPVGGPVPAAAPEEGTGEDGDVDEEDDADRRLTPRQARRLRMVLSAVGMAAMAVVLVLRIASRSSVLVVGVYGLALILCGIVIELSRNGRTRLGSWLLAVGLVAAIGSDWLLIP